MPTAIKPAAWSGTPTLLHIDPHQSGQKQAGIHTRWHPDIPCIGDIQLGKTFKVECIDYSGGQVHNDDCADDILDLDHDTDHHLSGPFHVPGAQAGDVLEIDILDIRPFDSQPWGYCMTSPGLGSLDQDDDPVAVTKTIWDFHGVETSSRHIPHVSFHGKPHPGVVGTAPSPELLAEWTRRETALVEREIAATGRTGTTLPVSSGAYVGQDLPDELRKRIYREGARTSPAREHGGNIDIGSLVRGSKIYLPVYVPGAKLSVGDLHFCLGDGEPTTAIEMSGIVTLRVNLIPRTSLSIHTPIYQTSPSEPQYPRQLVFTGISVNPHGLQTPSDGLTSYRMAAFEIMNYLARFGYTKEQVYVLLACAPFETKVVATANRPNFNLSIGVPLDIFDFDITPRGPRFRITEPGPATLSPERLKEVISLDQVNGSVIGSNGHSSGVQTNGHHH